MFNNSELLERLLLRSLRAQSTGYELITVDNRKTSFPNAATALNWGASRATGDWVLFVHQDVALLAADWLSRAEESLQRLGPTGWVGIVGCTWTGEQIGLHRLCAALRGLPSEGPAEVQTLDEALLIRRRQTNGRHYFDKKVPGWHAYGVEACCTAIRAGGTNHILSLPILHESKSGSGPYAANTIDDLRKSHRYVWGVHGAALGQIYTTCGTLPASLMPQQRPTIASRALRRLRTLALGVFGYRDAYLAWFEELLESMTERFDRIDCLHSRSNQLPIEAEAFVPCPARWRSIIHRFSGLELGRREVDCVVVAPDLASELPHPAETAAAVRRSAPHAIFCREVDGLGMLPRPWRSILRESASAKLAPHFDGTATALIRL